MALQKSYNKIENDLWPAYRDRLNKAESTEDVKKFFVYTAVELLQRILQDDDVRVQNEDIQLEPESKPQYGLSSRLLEEGRFEEIMTKSDLDDILDRLARAAAKRYHRLGRNPDKDRARIFTR